MTKVVVGLSGGVDSSVAAALLVEQGYEVIGVFMRNWNDNSVVINKECPWIDDSNDALLVAEKLQIPFQVLDLSVEYKKRIVDYMIAEYDTGRTPNPDILCNKEVKFDIFLKAAMQLGAEYVATGHYCRKISENIGGNTIYKLMNGIDENKDQSYFLCQVSQYQLSKALFPIGNLKKNEVRDIARKYDLITADKKDSQGLCFIGKIKLPEFLKSMLTPNPGEIVELPNMPEMYHYKDDKMETLGQKHNFNIEHGKVVGKHTGIQFYTIGQRKGLGVGGTIEPLFVLDKNQKSNTLIVGRGEDHRGLYRKGIFVKCKDIHWIREDLEMNEMEEMNVKLRIRYRQPLFDSKLYMKKEGLYIIFEQEQKSIASGQFAAWYIEDELIGSGVID